MKSPNWFRRQSPLLLLPPPPPPADELRHRHRLLRRRHAPFFARSKFFSVPHGRGFGVRFLADSSMRSKQCVGASRGWLVLLDIRHHHLRRSHVQLLNPFTEEVVPLPPLQERREDNSLFGFVMGFVKAAISGDRTVSLCVHSVVFCRPGDVRWTRVERRIVERPRRRNRDVIYFQGSFRILVSEYSDDDHEDFCIFSFDPRRGSNGLETTATTAALRLPRCTVGYRYMYLVESLGELLLVARTMEERSSGTVGLEAFRFDPQRGGWTETLDIGERMIFVGSRSESVSLHSCEPSSSRLLLEGELHLLHRPF